MAKPATNKQIINIFTEIALILRAENVPFKPQAYERAVESIALLEEELSHTYKDCGKKCITDIPGIGKAISEKIEELVLTGKLKAFEKMKKKYPFDMLELTRVQDVGSKTALMLFKKLKIKTLSDLERAAKKNKITDLPGMGIKTQCNILRGIQFLKSSSGRQIIHTALPLAHHLADELRSAEGVTHVDIAGSIRRRKETIGDIDLLVTTSKPKQLIAKFKSLPQIDEVLEQGPTKLAVRYKNGMNGDLRILKSSEYGAGLLHFTGSKEHNVLLRELAIKKKMKLSEYGLFKRKKLLTSRTEKNVYALLGLQFIPPEIRVGLDEVELAKKKKIPKLIEYGSLKGDLQIQTNWSDGTASIEEMARVAKTYGLSYIAITDHTQSLTIASGIDEKQLLKQGREIDKLNKKLKGFKVLKSTECEIKKDGSLDLNDKVLKTLDFVSVSIHSNRKMKEKEMTERIIRALKHPLVNILLHPSGRIVGTRDGFAIDMEKVIKAAKEYKVALEVNGSYRLDPHEKNIRQAVDLGVKLVISSDAHDPDHFNWLEYGIGQARRGWVKKSDVLNTKPLSQFLKAIKK